MPDEMLPLQRHPLIAYFVLTVAISWGAILAVIGPGGLPATADRAPTIGMALLLGPTSAMLIMMALTEGGDGFRELWYHLRQWRLGGGNLAIALLTAPVSATGTLSALSLFDGQFVPKLFVVDGKLTLLLTSMGAGLFIAVFEELGWTGFAVPRLLRTHGTFSSGVIAGLVWGLWHFPPFWQADSFSGPAPVLLLLARLFSWIVAFRVIMVWLYRRTDSLLAAILMHMSLVVCMIAVEPPLKESALLTYIIAWTVVLWMVVLVGGRLLHGKDGRSLQ